MDVATGALDGLLPKLAQLLKDEYRFNLQKGARGFLKFLLAELESINATLNQDGLAPIEHLGELVRLWARDITELSYDIEDMVDTFLMRVDDGHVDTNLHMVKRLGEKAISLCGVKKNTRTRHQIADNTGHQIEDEIKEFCVRIMELSERHHRFRNEELSSSRNRRTTGTVDPRLPALYRNERELVGINEARDEIVRMLQLQGDDDREVKIVSILGMGGIGKTTLAKAVYNSIEGQFDCSAFVSVPRNPVFTKVFGDILLQLDEAKYCKSIIAEPMDPEELIRKIRHFLNDKRYFIVVDDLWNMDLWQILQCVLIDKNCQSRIITTTRIHGVAVEAAKEAIYRLKPLSHADSKRLFYKRMFGGEGNCPDNQLAEVSDKILKDCDGLPLAITTIASVLASKPRDEWSEVYNSIAWRHESNRYVDNMRAILSFGYYDMPRHLRACLLHLSVFPEDCWIEKDLLIWKWIAEGFVRDHPGVSLFEEGECYFNELADRSLIQIEEGHFRGGRVYGCRVHPALLSVIRFLAREEWFSTVLDDEHLTSPGSFNITRRLALHKRNVVHNNMQAANTSMEKVRSFNASLCFMDWMPQLPRFRVLRVLALEYCPGMDGNHLKEIGNLVHLRYLGLVGAGVLLEFPEEAVRGLKFLQTLDLRETGIEQLPQAIFQLRHLMCLCVDWIARAVMWGEGSCVPSPRLRQLVVGGIWFSRLPAWINRYDLPELSHVHVGVEVVEDRDMETIGRLPWLRSLMLVTVRDEQRYTIITVGGGDNVAFRNLKFFTTNVPIKFERGLGTPLPNLEDLELRIGVRAAKDADSWFGSIAILPSLQKVMVALECHGASAAEVEEADAAVRRAIGILRQDRPTLEVITKHEPDKVPLIDQFRPKNPRFEALRCEMEKMQADRRQVQIEPDQDSQEISPAETARQ